ncbi:hypothetical protein LG047_07355 [Methylocystis sp. WRRC1]|uniref:hypothetical protein n=1 Tax=unclassified Methylocystis TaxID=2625913 RepID=UPI0001F883EA|nr:MULTISPECIES: hypothetical protein [unclassified Methylocystis]MCC3245135.1 hypothetical protein [Methylocystis sp. WRRC1]
MYKSIKYFAAAGACIGLLFGASALAQQTWAPPAEIAPKAAEGAPAAGASTTAAPAANAEAAPMTKAEKEKSCAEQAAAKGLKGKAKKQFKAECMK